jgi:UPF0271 protein
MEIDLNADLGEGAGTDEALMPLITSANVCCGEHAGSDETTLATLRLARVHGVVVGAHPGYADRENFGRVHAGDVTPGLAMSLRRQLDRFRDQAESCGVPVAYVKPHGALYNQAMADDRFAALVLDAVTPFGWPVMGLPESKLESACLMAGHPFVREGFADRRYSPDGTLVPRSEPDAVLGDVKDVVEQVTRLVETERVHSVCVHGDTPDAVAFLTAVRGELRARGHELRSFA